MASSNPDDPDYAFESKNASDVGDDPEALGAAAFEVKNTEPGDMKEADMPNQIIAKLDKLLGTLNSLHTRMDALEAGKARADSTSKERAAEMRQALEVRHIRKIAEVVAAQQNAMDKRTRANNPDEIDECVAIMGRFDSAFAHVGRKTPEPLRIERPAYYVRRLMTDLSRYHPDTQLSSADYYAVADSNALAGIEKTLIGGVLGSRDAILKDVPEGQMVERVHIDPYTGGRTKTFHARHTFISEMKPPAARLRRFKSGGYFRNVKANPPDQPV
jgi:hypothetical protein